MKGLPGKGLFTEVAQEMGIDEAVAEKDWLVTEVISVIAGVQHEGFHVVFSGGTCLSKAYHLLHRFSEDIDFRVLVKPGFENKKSLSHFKKSVIARLQEYGFKIQDDQINARDSNRFFSIDIQYASGFQKNHSLRPHLLIEMTARAIQLPSHNLSISSFLNQLAGHPPEVPSIQCIDPVESAADKLSAIAWRIPDRVRGHENDDPSIVRHIHDLAILKDRALAHTRFRALVNTSMEKDDQRARNDKSLNGLPFTEKLNRLLTVLDGDTDYRVEYERFVQGVSYARAGETPDFAAAQQAIHELVTFMVV